VSTKFVWKMYALPPPECMFLLLCLGNTPLTNSVWGPLLHGNTRFRRVFVSPSKNHRAIWCSFTAPDFCSDGNLYECILYEINRDFLSFFR